VTGRVELRLFATAREAVGTAQLSWPLPSDGRTVAQVLAEVTARHRRLAPVLATSQVFVNGDRVRDTTRRRARPGDDIAVHPPYSGG
jgi:molybdopterin converting factor small subunit